MSVAGTRPVDCAYVPVFARQADPLCAVRGVFDRGISPARRAPALVPRHIDQSNARADFPSRARRSVSADWYLKRSQRSRDGARPRSQAGHAGSVTTARRSPRDRGSGRGYAAHRYDPGGDDRRRPSPRRGGSRGHLEMTVSLISKRLLKDISKPAAGNARSLGK